MALTAAVLCVGVAVWDVYGLAFIGPHIAPEDPVFQEIAALLEARCTELQSVFLAHYELWEAHALHTSHIRRMLFKVCRRCEKRPLFRPLRNMQHIRSNAVGNFAVKTQGPFGNGCARCL